MERVWGRLAGWLIETLRSALPVHRVEASWIMLLRKRRVVNLAFVIERHASCKPARNHFPALHKHSTISISELLKTPSLPPSLPPLP